MFYALTIRRFFLSLAAGFGLFSATALATPLPPLNAVPDVWVSARDPFTPPGPANPTSVARHLIWVGQIVGPQHHWHLLQSTTGHLYRLRSGDWFDTEWWVQQIDARGLVLQHGDRGQSRLITFQKR